MSIKEKKEITKTLVKVEVVILVMIFTIILLHTMPLAGTAMFVVDCISIGYMPKQNLRNTRKSSIKGSFFYFYPRLDSMLF